jgi:hypothetical protein
MQTEVNERRSDEWIFGFYTRAGHCILKATARMLNTLADHRRAQSESDRSVIGLSIFFISKRYTRFGRGVN